MRRRSIQVFSLASFMAILMPSYSGAEPTELNRRSADTKVSVVSVNGYREVDVTIKNSAAQAKTFQISGSDWFQTVDGNQNVQDLAVVFPTEVKVAAGGSTTVRVKTACKQASRSAPSSGQALKPGTTSDIDRKFGRLVKAYHSPTLHGLITNATGADNHASPAKKHQFLQLITWIYYQSERRHMVQFAAKHMFKGDRAKAQRFIDRMYPLAKQAIDLYKATPIPPKLPGIKLPF